MIDEILFSQILYKMAFVETVEDIISTIFILIKYLERNGVQMTSKTHTEFR